MKVYVSATAEDLRDYRRAVYDLLRKLRVDAIAMEDYVAGERRPLVACLEDVGKADVYVGIFAWRYGYVPQHDNPDARSITELEYQAAGRWKKERLIFMLKDDAPWRPQHMDTHTGEGEEGKKIKRLRDDLCQKHIVSFFSSPEELARDVSAALSRLQKRLRVDDDAVAEQMQRLLATERVGKDEYDRVVLRSGTTSIPINVGYLEDGTITLSVLLEKDDTGIDSLLGEIEVETEVRIQKKVMGLAQAPSVQAPTMARARAGLDLGSYVRHIDGVPGSLTAFVTSKAAPDTASFVGFVSCSSTLALLNRAQSGDLIVSPPELRRAYTNEDVVGTLERFTLLRRGDEENSSDAAVVRLVREELCASGNWIPDPGGGEKRQRLTEVVPAEEVFSRIGETVYKVDRMGGTGFTSGQLEFSNVQRYPISFWDGGHVVYTDLFAVKALKGARFSGPGDTGALVFTREGAGLGMVLGGNKEYSFCLSLEAALSSVDAVLLV